MKEYEVIVSNIGCVHRGTNKKKAMKEFADYMRSSKLEYGRAGGESVDLYSDGEIIKEFTGSIHASEMNDD